MVEGSLGYVLDVGLLLNYVVCEFVPFIHQQAWRTKNRFGRCGVGSKYPAPPPGLRSHSWPGSHSLEAVLIVAETEAVLIGHSYPRAM